MALDTTCEVFVGRSFTECRGAAHAVTDNLVVNAVHRPDHAAREAAGWAVEQVSGDAESLHGSDVSFERRALRVHRVTAPAVVLGSTQSMELVDREAADAAGIEIARRRSGGGAVYLAPDQQLWIDVVLPAADELWDDDVGRASWWLGDVWAATIASLGSASLGSDRTTPRVHRGGVSDRALGRLVCFAAVGPGEVEIDGRKVVGISQRRSRVGARFQCVVYLRWDPDPLLSVLRLGPQRSAVEVALRQHAGALDRCQLPGSGWSVVEEFLRHLP